MCGRSRDTYRSRSDARAVSLEVSVRHTNEGVSLANGHTHAYAQSWVLVDNVQVRVESLEHCDFAHVGTADGESQVGSKVETTVVQARQGVGATAERTLRWDETLLPVAPPVGVHALIFGRSFFEPREKTSRLIHARAGGDSVLELLLERKGTGGVIHLGSDQGCQIRIDGGEDAIGERRKSLIEIISGLQVGNLSLFGIGKYTNISERFDIGTGTNEARNIYRARHSTSSVGCVTDGSRNVHALTLELTKCKLQHSLVGTYEATLFEDTVKAGLVRIGVETRITVRSVRLLRAGLARPKDVSIVTQDDVSAIRVGASFRQSNKISCVLIFSKQGVEGSFSTTLGVEKTEMA